MFEIFYRRIIPVSRRETLPKYSQKYRVFLKSKYERIRESTRKKTFAETFEDFLEIFAEIFAEIFEDFLEIFAEQVGLCKQFFKKIL